MITIQAQNVAELRGIFEEMFPAAVVAPEAQAPAPKKTTTKTADPPKQEEPKVDPPNVKEPKAEEKKVEAGKTQVEVPDITAEVVLNRIKALKAGKVPDIIDRVVTWRDGKKLPKLPEMTAAQLADTLTFVNGLEG